jgi:hypothetical protein
VELSFRHSIWERKMSVRKTLFHILAVAAFAAAGAAAAVFAA